MFDGAGGQGHGAKVPVVHGFFNVLLGEWDTAGRSIATAFDGADRYVEIQVAGNTAIRPRQRILTAPFAFKANSAEKLTLPGGSSATAVAVAGNGNVGIGTTSPAAPLHVRNNGASTTLLLDSTFGRGASLALQQNGIARGGMGVTGTWLGNTSSNLGIWAETGSRLAFYVNGSSAERLTIATDGNVGIGTTAPQTKLDVNGNMRVIGSLAVSGEVSGEPGGSGFPFSVGEPTGTFANWMGTGNNIPFVPLIGAGNPYGGFGMAYGSSVNSPIVWFYESEDRNCFQVRAMNFNSTLPAGTPLFTIRKQAGAPRVGIGTEAPTATLDVVGTVKASAFHGDGSQLGLAAGLTVPIGGVIMWWGTLGTIPTNFELCNGAAPTTSGATLTGNKPDLRDRFPKGATSAASDVKTTPVVGGANTIAQRNTGGTVLSIAQMPAHTHPGLSLPGTGGGWQSAGPGLNRDATGSTGGGQSHDHSIPAHDNRPAFLEMFYIIRVK